MNNFFTDLPYPQAMQEGGAGPQQEAGTSLDPNIMSQIGPYILQYLRNLKEVQVGAGDVAFHANREGLWLGKNTFADALQNAFAVDMRGNLYCRNAVIAGYQVFEAIVDASGMGHYTTLGAAITAGKKRIFIRNGVYNEGSVNITIETGTEVIGESRDGVVLQNCNINIKGTFKYGTGTIATTVGSTSVTGTGTSWSGNAAAGDYLFTAAAIGETGRTIDTAYKISNVGGNTSITLAAYFSEESISGAAYKIATVKENVRIENMTLGSNAYIFTEYCRNSTFRNINGNALVVNYNIGTHHCLAEGFYSEYTTLGAVNFDQDSFGNVYRNSFIKHVTGTGVSLGGTGNMFLDNQILNGGTIAVNVVGYKCIVGRNNIRGTSAGSGAAIKLDSGNMSIVIDNLINGGYNGIESAGSLSNRSIMKGNIVNACRNHGILITDGDKNIIQSNSVYGCSGDGIRVENNNDHTIIDGNQSIANGGRGIHIVGSGCDKTIVSNNVALNNATANFTDAGTGTVNDNNVTS